MKSAAVVLSVSPAAKESAQWQQHLAALLDDKVIRQPAEEDEMVFSEQLEGIALLALFIYKV